MEKRRRPCSNSDYYCCASSLTLTGSLIDLSSMMPPKKNLVILAYAWWAEWLSPKDVTELDDMVAGVVIYECKFTYDVCLCLPTIKYLYVLQNV